MFAEIRSAVRKIPQGKVSTYGAVAKAAGFPGNARRVAWALRNTEGKLPWHRVLGAGGKILLPRQAGAEQRLRLESEGVAFRGGKVDMKRHEFRFRQRQAR
ncbi:MAG TPA: MGMT family protein [Bryobacteraceae bacterium]|jgi:methylated-DNA-protein-cysteine methyltransferase-like protein|nr:MGMT family protein [Bryobacteraceae bacterium]